MKATQINNQEILLVLIISSIRVQNKKKVPCNCSIVLLDIYRYTTYLYSKRKRKKRNIKPFFFFFCKDVDKYTETVSRSLEPFSSIKKPLLCSDEMTLLTFQGNHTIKFVRPLDVHLFKECPLPSENAAALGRI